MVDKKRVILNASSTVAQVIITSCLYFLLYKLLLNKVGASMLGVWSLIVTTSSIANLANFGITSGLVKFVAEYSVDKLKEKRHLQQLVFTSFATLIVFYSFIIILITILANYILKVIIPSEYFSIGKELLPYSLFCLFVNGCGGVFVSVLEGFQKNYLRNFIYSIGSVLFFLVSWLLIDKFKLKGVVFGQVIQSLFVLICCLISCLKLVGYNLFNSWKWNGQIFKSIFNYGIKFQFISISQMLCEPITKTLLGRFGGMQIVGFYEMASRLVWQLRSLIVNANQIVVPLIASASVSKNNKSAVNEIYKKSLSIVQIVSIPIFTLLILFANVISFLWIGHIEPAFIMSIYLLSASTFANILSGPSYFGCLAEGKLNFLLGVHIFIAVTNVILSFILGNCIVIYGVIWSWSLTLILGSIGIIYLYSKSNKISLSSSFQKKDLFLISTCIAICLISFQIGIWITNSKFFGQLILACSTSFVVIILIFFTRKELILDLIAIKKNNLS